MTDQAPVAAAFILGAALSLIPMVIAVVRGRRERRVALQELAERTAALHDSQERYRAIVDRAEGIFLADAATKELIECNAALRALLGYSAEETAQLTLYDFDGDTRDGVDAAFRQLTDGKRPLQLDRRYRHKDQSRIEVTLHASVFMAEVVPIASVDGRTIGSGTPGPTTLRLMAAYGEFVCSTGTPIEAGAVPAVAGAGAGYRV